MKYQLLILEINNLKKNKSICLSTYGAISGGMVEKEHYLWGAINFKEMYILGKLIYTVDSWLIGNWFYLKN